MPTFIFDYTMKPKTVYLVIEHTLRPGRGQVRTSNVYGVYVHESPGRAAMVDKAIKLAALKPAKLERAKNLSYQTTIPTQTGYIYKWELVTRELKG